MRVTHEGHAVPLLTARLGSLMPVEADATPTDRAADLDAYYAAPPEDLVLVQQVADVETNAAAYITSLSLPAASTENNILICLVGNTAAGTDPPVGFTLLASGTYEANARWAAVYAKVSTGETTVTFAGAGVGGACVMEYSGFGGSIPVVDTWATTNNAGASQTVPAITPTTGIKAVLAVAFVKDPSTAVSAITDYTAVSEAQSPTGRRMRVEFRTQHVDSTSGTYGSYATTSGDVTDKTIMIHMALRAVAGTAWYIGPNITDSDDTTYQQVDVEGDDDECLRIDLGDDYAIATSRLRLASQNSGSKTYTIEGADEPDFSDAVTLDSVTFTASGSYTAQDVAFSWVPAAQYRYYQVTGTNELRRFHSWELREANANLASYQLLSEKDEANGYAGLNAAGFVPFASESSNTRQLNGVSVTTAATSNYHLVATSPTTAIWTPNTGGGGGGVTGITANGSNSLVGAVNLVAGTDIALGVSSQDVTITYIGTGGGAPPASGPTHSYGGYNGIGATAAAFVANRWYCKKFTVASDSIIGGVDAYVKPNADGATPTWMSAIWEDASGSPGITLTASAQTIIALDTAVGGTGPAGWLHLPTAGLFLAAGTYWAGVITNSTSYNRYYDASVGDDKYFGVGSLFAIGGGYFTVTATTDKQSIRVPMLVL